MNCPDCKNNLENNWLFCPFCGHKAVPTQAQSPAPVPAQAPRASSYGSGIRAQIMELAVRQALCGQPWRQTCASVMKANNITEHEVEEEVRRRIPPGGLYTDTSQTIRT
jgi:hypothetical protein